MDIDMTPVWPVLLGIGMAMLGNITHVLKRVVEASAAGEPVTIRQYVKTNPYRVALGIVGAASVVGLMVEIGQLTAMSGFAAGYMADSGLSILSARQQRSLS